MIIFVQSFLLEFISTETAITNEKNKSWKKQSNNDNGFGAAYVVVGTYVSTKIGPLFKPRYLL